jgi:hypothetical protein
MKRERKEDMREWQDVEFNGAADVGPHLRTEDGVILVDDRSLLAAMSRTDKEDWRQIASPESSGRFKWFGNGSDRLTARVEDETGFCWSAHIFDNMTAQELATLCVPLGPDLLLEAA